DEGKPHDNEKRNPVKMVEKKFIQKKKIKEEKIKKEIKNFKFLL
ncbi:Csa1 family protein, partial [Staphylococcus aureus]|nr:Csa1 family protein [Staphylococcus aureus]